MVRVYVLTIGTIREGELSIGLSKFMETSLMLTMAVRYHYHLKRLEGIEKKSNNVLTWKYGYLFKEIL